MTDLSQLITFNFPGPILFGLGAVREVGRQGQKMGGTRPLLVTGPHIAASGLLEQVLAPMEEAGLEVVLFQDAQVNPTDEDVKAGAARYREAGCDIIIALGGGSRMDAAKGIRVLTTHTGDLEQYYFDAGGGERITPNMPPLICIPTTAGSGSEVSRGAIITDTTQNRKRLIVGPGLMSSMAILDPELTVTMSPKLTAMSGMDALSHAFETYVGTNFNPIAQALSRQAAAMIYTYLPRAVENGNDLEARAQMLIASAMAALGFAKGVGVIHALGHQFSTEANIPHGLAVAILLPHGMEFNMTVAPHEYADLARAMNVVPGDTCDEDAACAAIGTVRELIRQLGLPATLSEAGAKWESIPRMAAYAMLDHCHRTNPRSCMVEDMQQLLERAF